MKVSYESSPGSDQQDAALRLGKAFEIIFEHALPRWVEMQSHEAACQRQRAVKEADNHPEITVV